MNLKTLSAALAMAAAPLALAQLNAAPFVGPSGPPGVSTSTTTVAKKGKEGKEHKAHKAKAHHRMRHHRHHKGKRMHSKGPGRCGMHMYYSRKHGHCMDARKK
jgi:ABC-type Zn2+ transport system substrate-binding protein/surface adhesin